jgi:hypothetical protein
MKWRRSKARSGEFNLIRLDGIHYCITWYLEVISGAQALARLLHGPGKFQVEIRQDSYDTLGRGISVIVARHSGQPTEDTVEKARKMIQSAMAEVGAYARIMNWERSEISPAPRRPPADDDDDDSGAFGMPLPLRS